MKGIYNNILASCLIGIILFSGCSVTKHLPEGEVLYTGGKTVVENKSATPVGETALTEIDAALDKTPSTKMLGGLLPIPFKMWMYNDFVKYKKGFGKWMFNRLLAGEYSLTARSRVPNVWAFILTGVLILLGIGFWIKKR